MCYTILHRQSVHPTNRHESPRLLKCQRHSKQQSALTHKAGCIMFETFTWYRHTTAETYYTQNLLNKCTCCERPSLYVLRYCDRIVQLLFIQHKLWRELFDLASIQRTQNTQLYYLIHTFTVNKVKTFIQLVVGIQLTRTNTRSPFQ
jgi:hypothetical protein